MSGLSYLQNCLFVILKFEVIALGLHDVPVHINSDCLWRKPSFLRKLNQWSLPHRRSFALGVSISSLNHCLSN
ncbi:hypothetical protein H5410_053694 [Solanum commersonii]|uniref:Uncharacterized protein n=1 Tax=Solanum commersonii TaxID=4109 RepID=A0A9J5X4K8_SOLCO|nr:hypothetical protein H5410_053694 [Solanum commersonii]